MKIIFSPSKEMREENIFANTRIKYTQSQFSKKTQELLELLRKKSVEDIEKIMKIKGSLLEETFYNIQNFDNLKNIPAISMYYGVAFKELELTDYDEKVCEYMQSNLYILSAFYGLSSPFDLVKKYRLDMTMSIIEKGLYSFWKTEVNKYIKSELKENEILLNLASGEFSKIIDTKSINMINLDFKEKKGEVYKSVSSYSKQARGKFLNYIIKNKLENIEDIKKIRIENYIFNLELSNEKNLIFTR